MFRYWQGWLGSMIALGVAFMLFDALGSGTDVAEIGGTLIWLVVGLVFLGWARFRYRTDASSRVDGLHGRAVTRPPKDVGDADDQ